MMMLLALTLATHTASAPRTGYAASKPCPVAKCPWEKDPIVKPNPYSKYGPQTLVITDGTAITRLDYSNGNRCAEARDSILRQYQEQHPNVFVSALTVVCVPR